MQEVPPRTWYGRTPASATASPPKHTSVNTTDLDRATGTKVAAPRARHDRFGWCHGARRQRALFLERRSQLKQTLAGIVEAAGGAKRPRTNDAGGGEARPKPLFERFASLAGRQGSGAGAILGVIAAATSSPGSRRLVVLAGVLLAFPRDGVPGGARAISREELAPSSGPWPARAP